MLMDALAQAGRRTEADPSGLGAAAAERGGPLILRWLGKAVRGHDLVRHGRSKQQRDMLATALRAVCSYLRGVSPRSGQ